MERVEALEMEHRDIVTALRSKVSGESLRDQQSAFQRRLSKSVESEAKPLTDAEAIDLIQSMRAHRGANRKVS
jgi:hypothetical protein